MDGHDDSDRLREIESALASIERRLRTLEGADVPTPVVQRPASLNSVPVGDIASLLGRTFLVVGGAYFLRALTESGRIPLMAGVIAGLAYASVWLTAAARSVPAKRLSAEFHGVAALLVALPVIWEGTVRFAMLSAPVASVALGAVASAALAIAARRRLKALAHVAAFGTVVTAFSAGWSIDHYGVFALLLIALSTATYWYSERPRHAWLRWPVAVAAGVAVIMVTVRASSSSAHESVAVAVFAQAFLLAAMQGSLAIRTILFSRNVRFFDILQGFFSLAIGIGGATLLARGSMPVVALVGVATALLAAGAYIAAFFRLADRPHLEASYHAFAAFGLVAGTAALILVFSGHPLAIASLALAVVTLALGQRRLGGYAALHAAAFLLVSVVASDLLTTAVSVWTSQPNPWPSMDLVACMTLGAAGACAVIPVPERAGIGGVLARIGRLVMASVFVVGAGGAAVLLIAPLVSADAGTLATLRTVLLSLAVFGLSLASRVEATAVFARLVYPVLILGGLKLVVDDFRYSRPSRLFVALAFYGLALVMAGRARTAASRTGRAGD